MDSAVGIHTPMHHPQKSHGSRQNLCCLEKLHGRTNLTAERSVMQKPFIMKMKVKKKPIQLYVNIFIYLCTLNHKLQGDVSI